ncbi:MAG TPA: sigma-70 family RNA polymerase sigma factor [Pyrinomonadaceae bacterium]|nr:sigma-70 family RNA polymerase sigma factor [Pyrinomonadaceae bacterium]
MTESNQIEPRVPGDENERSLLRRVAAGDVEAFKTLHQAYQKRLFAYAMKMLGDAGAAEELSSDVMFEVWKQARQFRGKSKVSTWIFGIAHYKTLNALRRKGPGMAVTLDQAKTTSDRRPDPEQLAERCDMLERLETALGHLSLDHREVIELTFYHEFSYEEIAQIMNCPVNTVKSRMFYAKQKMREVLSQLNYAGIV